MLAAFEAAEFYTRVTGIPAAGAAPGAWIRFEPHTAAAPGQGRAAGQLHPRTPAHAAAAQSKRPARTVPAGKPDCLGGRIARCRPRTSRKPGCPRRAEPAPATATWDGTGSWPPRPRRSAAPGTARGRAPGPGRGTA